MNNWLKFTLGFVLLIAALSVVGFLFNVIATVLLFGFKLFVFGSIGYGIYYYLHKKNVHPEEEKEIEDEKIK